MKGWKASFLLVALGSVLLGRADVVPAKTTISVRTTARIDAKSPTENKSYSAVIDGDVLDATGRVLIPRGSQAKVILCESTHNTVVLDLESIEVNGRRYPVATNSEAVAIPAGYKGSLPPQTPVTFRLDEPVTIAATDSHRAEVRR